jgi:hypothetical protein
VSIAHRPLVVLLALGCNLALTSCNSDGEAEFAEHALSLSADDSKVRLLVMIE